MLKKDSTLTVIIVAFMLLFAPVRSLANNDYVAFAKSLCAKDYDPSLPAIPLERWLTSILPHGTEIVWGDNETDCGEQTGVSGIDKERDIPLCVEVRLMRNNNNIGYLSFFIGTDKKGKMKKRAGLYYGFIRQKGKETGIKKLGELKKLKKAYNAAVKATGD
jgi:hypothetical protein